MKQKRLQYSWTERFQLVSQLEQDSYVRGPQGSQADSINPVLLQFPRQVRFRSQAKYLHCPGCRVKSGDNLIKGSFRSTRIKFRNAKRYSDSHATAFTENC